MGELGARARDGGSAVVRFDHVSKRFAVQRDRPRSFQEWVVSMFRTSGEVEELWALRDVSFTVGRGEAVAFIGANGAGKSSLLKLVNSILAPTEGTVTVDGRVSALLELGAGFHPDLTGRENVYLNGSILGLDRRAIDALFDSIVKFAELESFIDMPVKHYSSGMYMRLGFAVAIHAEPDVLVIDEVLAVGDAAFQAKCLYRILDLKRRGVTILLVSHDLESVRRLCDRAIWLENSRIQAEGPPDQVIARYLDSVAEHQLAHRTEERGDQPQGNRWGSYEAEITQVEFIGPDGRPTDVFDTGEAFTARIHYCAHEQVPHPMIGIAIHHEDGAHVTGPNTVTAGYDIPAIHGDGWVDYTIENLPLLVGTYHFTAAIYDYWETAAFDHHDRAFTFRVRPGAAERYGVVRLAARWSHVAAMTEAPTPEPVGRARRP